MKMKKNWLKFYDFWEKKNWFSNMSPCKNVPNQIDKLFMDKLGEKNNVIFKKMDWKC